MTKAEEFKALLEKLNALKAEVDAGKCKETVTLSNGHKLTFKISDKGGVSVYGIQRFPVTLFGNQWEALIEVAPALMEYINKNKEKLAVKQAA